MKSSFLFSIFSLFFSGIVELAKEACDAVEVCLAAKPLSDSMFRKITPGLRNGMILITGPKGSGRTMFAQALCKKHAEIPNLAYILNIDCKPLRGKYNDQLPSGQLCAKHIKKILKKQFKSSCQMMPIFTTKTNVCLRPSTKTCVVDVFLQIVDHFNNP